MPYQEHTSTPGWPAPAWSLSIQKRGPKQRMLIRELKPERPYVLIGASPHCDICLDEPQLPAVAYLVCNFERSVEVWPTAAIAFPRWGIMRPGEDLTVGRTRISLTHPSLTFDSKPESSPVELDVQFQWDVSARRSTLKRSVTIMGRDQPSMLRIQGQRLHKCDHALVAPGSDLWLINLCSSNDLFEIADNAITASPYDSSCDSQLTQLCRPGDAGRIGGVTISIGTTAGLTSEYDTPQLNIKHVVERSLKTEHRPRVWPAPVLEHKPTRVAHLGKTQALMAFKTSTVNDSPPSPDERVGLDVNQGAASERLDALLMDRMVRLRRQRVSKGRSLLKSLLTRVGVAGSAAASLVATSSIMSSIQD